MKTDMQGIIARAVRDAADHLRDDGNETREIETALRAMFIDCDDDDNSKNVMLRCPGFAGVSVDPNRFAEDEDWVPPQAIVARIHRCWDAEVDRLNIGAGSPTPDGRDRVEEEAGRGQGFGRGRSATAGRNAPSRVPGREDHCIAPMSPRDPLIATDDDPAMSLTTTERTSTMSENETMTKEDFLRSLQALIPDSTPEGGLDTPSIPEDRTLDPECERRGDLRVRLAKQAREMAVRYMYSAAYHRELSWNEYYGEGFGTGDMRDLWAGVMPLLAQILGRDTAPFLVAYKERTSEQAAAVTQMYDEVEAILKGPWPSEEELAEFYAWLP